MSIWEIIFLSVVQGLTEFVPISSSAHLVILPAVFKIAQPSLFFNICLHFGTFLSLLLYFRKEIIGFFSCKDSNIELFKQILIATFPAVLIGAMANDFFESFFQKPLWAAIFLIFTGIFLFFAEQKATFRKEGLKLNFFEALTIGVAQALAILPGISRSGATISAGLFLGLKREEAARFSFLLSLPIILSSFLFELRKLPLKQTPLTSALLGIFFSFISGYFVIGFLLKYLKRNSLYPFAIYCLLMGIVGAWWLS